MKIHEYQAKNLFRLYKVLTPLGQVASSVSEARSIAAELGNFPVVIKAQIHAGGRGKGGGVKLAHSLEEVEQYADAILGMQLITPQTGPEGKLVRKILVEAGHDIANELYLSILLDRQNEAITLMGCQEGGMDIEDTAATQPEKIVTVQVDPLVGLQPYHLRKLSYGLQIGAEIYREFAALVTNLFQLFQEKDCSLIEINPLIITRQNKVMALDAKMDFDSNGLFRQPEVISYRDREEEDPLELEASEFGLNYINLDGNVGNIVNGAGLAMATMDIIQQAGATPANFLDVGGGATAEMVKNGLRIILQDKKVKAVFINIFGGILRCDNFANGVVDAARELGLHVPVVVRMEGTNVEKGRKILADSGLNLITATDLKDGARQIAMAVA